MYNILLTDDEQIVVNSLSFIIEKNFPEEVNILTATSGSDAIYTCRVSKVDIIFIDINMPGLNGLEAVREIKQFNPKTVVIILSAFDKFQYAQEALSLGVFRYLTKPVNRNVVIQTVRNAIEVVEAERGKLTSDIQMKEKLNFVSSIVESDFIYSSIYSSGDGNTLTQYLEYFKLSSSDYFYTCVELPSGNGDNDSKMQNYSILRDVFTAQSTCIIGALMVNMVVVYIPLEDFPSKTAEEIYQKELCDKIYTLLCLKIGKNIKMGVGKIFRDYSKTQEAYKSAIEVMVEGINYSEKCKDEKKLSDVFYEYEQRLLSRISSGDVQGTKIQAKLLFDSIFAEGNIDFARNTVFKILLTSRNLASGARKGYSSQEKFNNTFSIISRLEDAESFSSYAIPEFLECAMIIGEAVKSKSNPIIDKAKEYISSRISEEISLEETASIVNVSPYYLSKLFKDETGCNFVDFVTESRLEKAKALLKKRDLNIKEISYQTGYSDQNYFSKIFRRKFGVTPTEYRNSLINSEE